MTMTAEKAPESEFNSVLLEYIIGAPEGETLGASLKKFDQHVWMEDQSGRAAVYQEALGEYMRSALDSGTTATVAEMLDEVDAIYHRRAQAL